MSKEDMDQKKSSSKDFKQAEEKSSDFFLNFMKKTRENEQKQRQLEESHDKKMKDKKDDNSDLRLSRLALKMSNLVISIFNQVNRWMDSMLSTDKRIRWLSLFMTVVIYFVVSGGTGITTARSIDIIQNVPVRVIKNDLYEVTGYQERVNIQLIGDFTDIQMAKLKNDYSVYLDASSINEGETEIRYMPDGFSSRLEVQIIPEKTNVTVSKIKSRLFPLSSLLIGKESLNPSISVDDPVLAFEEVEVKAGEATLEKIDRVVAKIDVSDINVSVDDITAPIVALDETGNELNVEINPKTVQYSMKVVEHSKVVPLKLDLQGNLANGYAIKEFILSTQSVTIYGDEQVLQSIDSISIPFGIEGREDDVKSTSITIEKPSGIVKMSENSVNVSVKIEKSISKQIDAIPILLQNIPEGYSATVVNDAKCSIVISGAQSICDAITLEDIHASIDLSQAKRGSKEYEVTLNIDHPLITYEWKTGQKVVVEIAA